MKAPPDAALALKGAAKAKKGATKAAKRGGGGREGSAVGATGQAGFRNYTSPGGFQVWWRGRPRCEEGFRSRTFLMGVMGGGGEAGKGNGHAERGFSP